MEQSYKDTLSKFIRIVRDKATDETMVALIIDSPWLPGYVGVNTLDFYFDQQVWLDTYYKVLEDLPGVAFVPGVWAEFGMANEPSGWGAKIQWAADNPPSMWHVEGGLMTVADRDVPNPETDGFMPAVLRQYERVKPILTEKGIAPKMAGARGPLAVASHLVGTTELLMATQLQRDECLAVIEKTTELCIRWLKAQLSRMDEPVGVLVLDDVVGMLSPADMEVFATPFLKRIFDEFVGMIRTYHNDTPNANMISGLKDIGMDVFNFSHEVSIQKAREDLGPDIVLMGNIPPLEVLVRGTVEQVKNATRELIGEVKDFGPILVSPGGGVSPGTPIKNLQAMLEVFN